MIQADSLEYPTTGVCTAALHCDVFIDCDLDTRTCMDGARHHIRCLFWIDVNLHVRVQMIFSIASVSIMRVILLPSCDNLDFGLFN
jgi:hypothetical protein